MLALEFIKWYMDTYKHSFISGSYPTHLLHGTGFNDIDVYSRMPPSFLKTEVEWVRKDSLYQRNVVLNGYGFTADGSYTLADTEFISYKSDKPFDDGVIVNIIVKPVSFLDPLSVFDTFDLSILGTAITDSNELDNVNYLSRAYKKTVSTKYITVCKKRTSKERIEKYKERFPDYTFVEEVQ